MAKSSYPGHVLKNGSHGAPVRKVQERLNTERAKNPKDDKHQPLLVIDGKYGPKTKTRVEQFQSHHKGPHGHSLAVNGAVDRFTWAALFKEPLASKADTGLGRLTPNVVIRTNVVNQSARASVPVDLIVLHDTESANIKGVGDLQGLANWFDNPNAQASSHVATDADGNSARFVRDSRKAWHVAAYNSASLGIEQVGFATEQSWPEAQLHETARWIAHWSIHHGIPIQKGAVSDGAVTRRGVLRHMDLGTEGGGHHDPGENFPFEAVLELAAAYRAARLAS